MSIINNRLLNPVMHNKIESGIKPDGSSSSPAQLEKSIPVQCELQKLLHLVKTTPVELVSKQKLEQYKAEILSDHYNPNIQLLINQLSDEILAEGILDE